MPTVATIHYNRYTFDDGGKWIGGTERLLNFLQDWLVGVITPHAKGQKVQRLFMLLNETRNIEIGVAE